MLERTDMLLGTGLVGGIMRNNGRFTATEEMLAMGGGEIFQLTDANSLHRDIEFPGHHHASLYNVATMEPVVKRFLLGKGVEIHLITRDRRCGNEGRDRSRRLRERRAEEKVRFDGGRIHRHHRHGRASGPVHQIRERLRHVHPPLPVLRRPGQHGG